MTRYRFAALLSVALSVAACASVHETVSADIIDRVRSIQQEQKADTRAELAMALSKDIKGMPNKATVQPAAVDRIAELLNDDSTRLWAAASLREIGPGARSAIPALKKTQADLKSRVLIHNDALPLTHVEAAIQAIETGP